VLVNNAGVGLLGAFEATPMSVVREVLETNTFGVMAMTQAVLPRFRARRSGAIVNVTSSATLAPMSLVAVYTASKMAIEGFTASLELQLSCQAQPDGTLGPYSTSDYSSVTPDRVCELESSLTAA
jgi:short-subunit dehydrogenase